MATIDVTRAHSLPKEDAKKKAEEFAKGMQERFELEWRWQGDSIVFDAPRGAAKGTKGEVNVTDKSVRVQIDLPFLLRVMKGTIESKVEEKLTKLL
jgi:putative polyhydroxyalkanoate system protein